MKTKEILCAIALVGCVSCSNENSVINDVLADSDELVDICFVLPVQLEPLTRTETAISTLATHLDVWIINGDDVQEIHHAAGTDGFGTVSVTLNKTKTYTIYAMAHKCESAVTLTDGVVSFPDNKLKESFFVSSVVNPSNTATLTLSMDRIVGKFSLETTDVVPDECTTIQLTFHNTPVGYGVDGTLTNPIDRVVTFANLSRRNDGTAIFSTYVLSTAEGTTCNITVDALDADHNVIESRDLANVPFKCNYRTSYQGALFVSSGFTLNLTSDDWNDFDTINF